MSIDQLQFADLGIEYLNEMEMLEVFGGGFWEKLAGFATGIGTILLIALIIL